VSHRIEFSPEALGDLIDLYDYIALRDGAERAIGYIDRIEDCCRNLSVFPERGIKRDDLRRGLRILGFECRAVIAFLVIADAVTILRILYGGRDLDTVFP
jgi:toxin ParE1/3/4